MSEIAAAQVRLEPNLQDPDGFYEQLLEAHQGLSVEQSFELNVRLLMLLANQVGDAAVLARCVALARESAPQGSAVAATPAKTG
ncbi:MAG: DUF2783 domain-containing protein [Lautropia sp.]